MDSGQGQWHGGIGGHGRKDLRCLLIQSAQAILRSKDPLAQWGKRLAARKSSIKLAVAAVARRLAVAVWYLMRGLWSQLQEIDQRLEIKVSRIISHMGTEALKKAGKTRQALRDETYQSLKADRIYVLDPNKQFTSRSKANSVAAEYGL